MGRVPGLRTARPPQISLCTEACRRLSLVCLGPEARRPALGWLIWASSPYSLGLGPTVGLRGTSCGFSALLAEPGSCPGGSAHSTFPGAPSPQELPLCYLPAALHPRLLSSGPSGMALCSAGCLLPPRLDGPAPGPSLALSWLRCSPQVGRASLGFWFRLSVLSFSSQCSFRFPFWSHWTGRTSNLK